VQVRCNEGLANRIGPEPCVCTCEGTGKASAGESIGQALSRESFLPAADPVSRAEGQAALRVNASAWQSGRGQRPWHVQTLLAREP
jgi:hypothetical protein